MQLTKRERFEQWQGPNGNTQKQFIDTAMRVEAYLSLKKLTLDQLKKDLEGASERSWHYKLVYNVPWQQRMKGILLYSILDLEEAGLYLSTPLEDTQLTAIFNDLHALYLSSFDKPSERIRRLLTHMHDLLDMDVWLFSDLKHAKKIHFTLYLGLGTLNQALNNLPYGSELFASMVGINFKEIHASVKTLLQRTEDKIALLEEALSMVAQAPVVEVKKQAEVAMPKLEVNKGSTPAPLPEEPDEVYQCHFIEQVPLSGKKKTIQDYFDAHYLELFTRKAPIKEQLKLILDYTSDLKVRLNQFKVTRAEEEQILGYQRQIERLKNAFEKNDAQIIGRKYFLELHERYHDEFILFKSLIPNEEREILEQNIEEQEENPGLLNGLYVLSTVFAPVNVLSRLLLSEEDKQGLSELTLTLDAQAKALVKDLVPIVLTRIDQMLQAKRKQKQQIQLCLSSGNRDLELLLSMASPADLAELSALNTVSQTFDELTSYLPPVKNKVTFVPIPLQDLFQKRYATLMKTEGCEKQKALVLIQGMNEITKDLQLLLDLNKRKQALLPKIKPLHMLMDLFHQHSSNHHIGSVVNVSLKRLQTQLNTVNKEFKAVVSRLSFGDPSLKESLKNSSIEHLHELLLWNGVPEPLLNLVNHIKEIKPGIDEFNPGEKTLQEYFKVQYSALLNHDLDEEALRLSKTLAFMQVVDQSLRQLISERTEYDALTTMVQQAREVFAVIEEHTTNLQLIDMMRERIQNFEQRIAKRLQAINTIAEELAQGNDSLKQLLVRKSLDKLTRFIEVNSHAMACIDEYKILKEKITLLIQMTKGTRVLDSYITQHYTWWIRFTNFLAQFLSIFQTDAGRMLDEARELKERIGTCKIQCERDIKTHIAVIKREPIIGPDLLSDLPEQHDYKHTELTDAEKAPFDVEQTVTLLSSLSMYAPKVRRILLEEQEELIYDERLAIT